MKVTASMTVAELASELRSAGLGLDREGLNKKLLPVEYDRWLEAIRPRAARVDKNIRRHNINGGKRPHFKGALRAWEEAGLGDAVVLNAWLGST